MTSPRCVLILLVFVMLAVVTQGARLRQPQNRKTTTRQTVTCQNKLMTSYTRRMLDAMRPSSEWEGTLHLQQRFIAGVHLFAGTIKGLEKIQPMEEPTRLFCHNDSVAALQTKFKVPDVETSYGFKFAGLEDVVGRLSLARQDFFIDIDLEKDQRNGITTLLGIYLTQPDDGFQFQFESGADHRDLDKIKAHVTAIAKMCFARDSRTAVMLDLAPKIDLFTQTSSFTLD